MPMIFHCCTGVPITVVLAFIIAPALQNVQCLAVFCFNTIVLKSSFRRNVSVSVGISVGIIGHERKIIILSGTEKSKNMQSK